jgi:fatty-acyl-CoA synthase
MVVLGGVGFRWGAIVGGVLYTILDQRLTVLARAEWIRDLPDVLRIPLSEPLFLLGVLFILVVMFLPGGIAGTIDAAVRRRRGERTRSQRARSTTRTRPSRSPRGARVSVRNEVEIVNGDLDGAHTIGRWLTDRAGGCPTAPPSTTAVCASATATSKHGPARLAASLRRAGYGPGDRLATITGNSIDHVVVFFACAKAGIAMVPLSWRLSSRELSEALVPRPPRSWRSRTSTSGWPTTRSRGGRTPPTTLLGTTGIEAAVPRRGDRRMPRPRAVRDDDPLPRHLHLRQRGRAEGRRPHPRELLLEQPRAGGVAQLTTEDIVLAVLPQFHVAAWNCQPLLAWWAGATVVLERSFQPRRVLQLLAERGVTAMMGVPTQYRLLIDDPGFAALARGRLRQALVGGATIPPALAARWADAGVPLTQGYGLTEAAPNVLCLPASEAARTPAPLGGPTRTWTCGSSIPTPVSNSAVRRPASCGYAVRASSPGTSTMRRRRRGRWPGRGFAPATSCTATATACSASSTGARTSSSPAVRTSPPRRSSAHFCCTLRSRTPPSSACRTMCGASAASRSSCVLRAALGTDEVLAHARAELASFKVPVRVAFVDELPRSTIEKLARSRLRAPPPTWRGSAREHS